MMTISGGGWIQDRQTIELAAQGDTPTTSLPTTSKAFDLSRRPSRADQALISRSSLERRVATNVAPPCCVFSAGHSVLSP